MKHFKNIVCQIAMVSLGAAQVLSTVAAEVDDSIGFELETIIVTAQKRSQNIQDVPISIATMSSERLAAAFDGGADIRALAVRIPSVYVEGSSGRTAPRFYIRGLGTPTSI